MERHALTFPVRPGTEAAAREVLRRYPRPDPDAGDGARLLATSVFCWRNHVVRVMDVRGPLPAIMRHVAADPAIRRTEEALNPLLARRRDLSDPEAVRAFFAHALMSRVAHQAAVPDSRIGRPPRTRVALRYPVRPGQGAALARVLAWGQSSPLATGARSGVAGTTVFRHGDLVIRVFDVIGDPDVTFARLGRAALGAPTVSALESVLEPGWELATTAGITRFLTEHRLPLVTHREAGVAGP
ncbi:hypothetical protein B1813_01605 [Saccharomonospora piscinae]|uniref:SchA/CurD-like domain-containing protein n=1 Tax=Saccharomonospora piscinae TaxID=687388 RepID=A0A1V9ACF6_SACPI|nr:SchA/CurD-like domain-containing protein [Saccharomonospora piscinae]OQO94809.1 hypothetical protein B1813_01605 [Saccharomonospora piscinae]TLW94479.1 hypothetical protein FFT09_00850 [Saccharomonospora piscinae]